MRIKNIALFSYDFPHKKTQDFLFRLYVENYNIKYTIAAPWKKLNIPKPTIRTSPSHAGLVHPKTICKKLDINYFVSEHNSKRTKEFITNNPVDLFIISGARILNPEITRAAKHKILNIHPGLLPKVRGLDTLLWSIYYNTPLGLTAHLISSKIDAGLFIKKERLRIYPNDTPIDISLRLLEYQSDFLIKSLKFLKNITRLELKDYDRRRAIYNTKMPAPLEKETIKKFPSWLKKYSKKKP